MFNDLLSFFLSFFPSQSFEIKRTTMANSVCFFRQLFQQPWKMTPRVSIIQTAKGVQIHYQTHSQKVKDGMAILISIALPNKKGNEMVKK